MGSESVWAGRVLLTTYVMTSVAPARLDDNSYNKVENRPVDLYSILFVNVVRPL